MTAWRCAALGAAVWSGMLVMPAAAQQVPEPAPPALVAPATPAPVQAAPAQPPGQPAPAQAPQPGPTPKASRRPAPMPTPPAVPARHVNWDELGLRGFSVALVVGDLAGGAAPDNLPAGAKKALADMRDFLPYKSYRLLDTHWILCCSGSGSHTMVSGRLRGAEEEEYVFYIQVRPDTDSTGLDVTFTLREAGAKYTEAAASSGQAATKYAEEAASAAATRTDRSRQLAELARQRVEIERQYSEARMKYAENHPERQAAASRVEEMRRKLAELEQGAARATTPRGSALREVLNSTFSMKVGETVVIGTSRLKGDKALIALLTAASRTATGPSRE